MITIQNQFTAAFERIPNAYKRIMEYLHINSFKEKTKDNILPCFEYVYNKNNIIYMDVFVHTNAVANGHLYTNFS